MNNISKNSWFWMLQLIGWFIPASMNVWGKLVTRTELSKTYIYLEGIVFFISGIIATLIVRRFLKKRLSFNRFQIKEIKIVLVSLLIGGTILFVLLIFFSSIVYQIVHQKVLIIKTLNVISTILNAYLFIIFWLLFYLSIKITNQFRKDKIERIELESSLKESQLNTLIGQINPHFMFNSLNNIRALMLEDVDKSREMITRLSEMLRYSLTQNSIHKIAISEELEMVSNYIELSKIQLEDRLTFKKEIDNSLLVIEIPPMIIQLLIENAIKHGISNLPLGGLVKLNIFKVDNELVIKVCNSGKLVMDKEFTKIGINNIKKRLSLMYGSATSFSLSEKENTVTAIINIPI